MGRFRKKATLIQLKTYIDQIVNVDGISRWEDLNAHQKKCIIATALDCQLIDSDLLWCEIVDMNTLVEQTIVGIHNAALLTQEILDRVEEAIADEANAMLHQSYLEYYGRPPSYDQEWLNFSNDEMNDVVAHDRRTMAKEWNAERAAANIPF